MVGDGYDAMGDTFADWRSRIVGDPGDEWEKELVSRLGEGVRMLELGCGAGTPETTQRLARRFRLTGVDISPRQVELARAAMPEAEFVCADFTDVELPASSFEAVTSFYAFNHVPRELLGPLLVRIHSWLVPGGWMMVAFGQSDLPGWTGDFLGATTYFASYPPETNSQLVRDAGFAIERDEVVTFQEPEPDAGTGRFKWVLAQR
jgi:cyclopropane fatty-acyl-phospholipid synthase-like methyltransferase